MTAVTFSTLGVERLQVLAVVEAAGSISGAARRLGCTAPAASQHLAALTREADADLIVTGPRGAVLTPVGRILAGHGRRITQTLREAEEAVGKHRGRDIAPSDLALTKAVDDLVDAIVEAAKPLALSQILTLVDQRQHGDGDAPEEAGR